MMINKNWFSDIAASREQLRCRQGSPALGKEAGAQTDREMLVWGWSGKKTYSLILNCSNTEVWFNWYHLQQSDTVAPVL